MLHACHVKVLELLVWGVPFPSPPPQFFPASLRGGPWCWFLQIWARNVNLPLETWGCLGGMAPCCPEGVRSPEPWSWPLSPAPLVPVGWPTLGRRDRRGESHSREQVSRGWVGWASPTRHCWTPGAICMKSPDSRPTGQQEAPELLLQEGGGGQGSVLQPPWVGALG